MIQISIITVGMNHLTYLKNLLFSLYSENNIQTSFEMIYIDNCSTDGSVEFISRNYPNVKIIQNTRPLGFGENNNKGVLASTGQYIAIINPDIIILKNSLDTLLNYIKDNLHIGIVVPKLLNPDFSIQYSVRGFITLKTLFTRIMTKGKDNINNKLISQYLCKNIDHTKIQPIDWAIGAALFMSKKTYAELGGFDVDYFLYMEDEDICLRCWELKKAVIYNPDAIMIHNHIRASSKLGKKTILHLKSMYTFFKKHGFSIKSPKHFYQ
ncbi:glycosyltransferase [Phocaeicola plebeius]|uniref:glycosyltransferase n=1 Tax=Phocaeicola plebeius TaxID=310297 RepID=UPI0026F0E197|nr:glycosyltransferase [Phocaeicola plebeius]